MRRACAFALLFLMIIPTAWAGSFEIAPPGGNWNKVQSIPQGSQLTVKLKFGETIEGDFVSLAEDTILLKVLDRDQTYPKDAVSEIRLMRQGSRLKNAAIAGGILFGVGFGLGYAGAAYIADQDSMPAGERAAAGAGIGAITGGVAAAIALAHRPALRSELIYQAR